MNFTGLLEDYLTKKKQYEETKSRNSWSDDYSTDYNHFERKSYLQAKDELDKFFQQKELTND